MNAGSALLLDRCHALRVQGGERDGRRIDHALARRCLGVCAGLSGRGRKGNRPTEEVFLSFV
jgi:hypothetical protein